MVDAEMDGVQVPVEFVSDGQIVLNVSPSAVKTLDLGNEWVFFNARFGGLPQDIHVPMMAIKAIYAQENGKGMVFAEEENVPPPSSPPPTDKQKSETKKPTLRVVK